MSHNYFTSFNLLTWSKYCFRVSTFIDSARI